MVDTGTSGKRAGGMAAGLEVRNPALRECAPRSGACDPQHVDTVAREAFTEIH